MSAQHRSCKAFLWSAAVLLLLTAGAKLYSATGAARILTATDPLLHLPYRTLLVGLGALETVIAAYLLFGRHTMAKLWMLFWLSGNFLMYRCASAYLHIKMCPCLGTIASALPLRKGEVDLLLLTSALCLFFGAAFTLVSASRERPAPGQIACTAETRGQKTRQERDIHDQDVVATGEVPQRPLGPSI